MSTLGMMSEKERQIQYCYQHTETETATGAVRNNSGCFREHEKKMEK